MFYKVSFKYIKIDEVEKNYPEIFCYCPVTSLSIKIPQTLVIITSARSNSETKPAVCGGCEHRKKSL